LASTNALANPVVKVVPLDTEAGVRVSNKRAYAQTFAATAVIRVFGVLSGVLAARLLGRTGRGELAVIVFMPLMLLSLGEFEFSRSVVIESSTRESVPAELVATAFWVACMLGLLEAALLVGVLRYVLPVSKLYLLSSARWFTLYLPACYVSASLTGIDQGRGRFGRFSLYQAMAGIIYVLLILCVIWPTRHIFPQTFAAAMLIGVVFTAAMRAGQDWAAICRTLPNWHLARKLLRRGFSFYIPALAGLALLRADMFLLVRLAPAAAIGAYAVAQAISMGQVGAVIPFVQVGFAAVAAEAKHERALETLLRHFRLAQIAVVAAALFAAALTSWGIRVFFGPEYLSATNTTYFLIAAAATWGIGETLEQGLRAAGHPGLGIVSNVAGLVALCALAVPAYLYFGIAGLASAALLGQLVSLLALIGLCVLRLKMRLRTFWAFDTVTFREFKRLTASAVRHFEKTDASVSS
jgi:O-antigen/teichoic acid export membrane protein